MVTYEITLPDGGTRKRSSARTYTHAVVAQGERGWGLVAFCGSPALAEKRAADWRRRVPTEPAQIVPTRTIVPLTDKQRALLTEIGDRTMEIMGTGHLVALVSWSSADYSSAPSSASAGGACGAPRPDAWPWRQRHDPDA
jgi:hypothetical protein